MGDVWCTEAMNAISRAAACRFPGRFHYAFLQWPGDGDVALASSKCREIGIQPIWLEEFSEIPRLIDALR